MLTRQSHGLIIVATSLFTLGLATGTSVLLGLSSIPLAALVLGLAGGRPELVEGTLEAPHRARAGDVLDVKARVTATGPGGLVAVEVEVPSEFDLVEGSNVHVVPKAEGRQELEVSFRVRATKRGHFATGPLQATALPATGLLGGPEVTLDEARELEVHPRVVPVRRLRSLRGTAATIAPEEDVAAIGLQTNDFKELRTYQWGDPPRSVNWKATARLAATSKPLVNEYEVEGRKAVWFLLDAGRHMAVGTNVENGFEVAIAAVSGLALAYLDRGYKVGFYAYNTEGASPLYPDVGTKQFLKIQRHLARLEPGEGTEGPLQAVLRCRSWLVSSSPMVVFVTRTEVHTDALEDALRRLRALTPGKARPMLVIEPQAFHLVPGDEAVRDTARLLDELSRPRYQRLRRLGATVLPWNPEEESLEQLLFRGVAPGGPGGGAAPAPPPPPPAMEAGRRPAGRSTAPTTVIARRVSLAVAYGFFTVLLATIVAGQVPTVQAALDGLVTVLPETLQGSQGATGQAVVLVGIGAVATFLAAGTFMISRETGTAFGLLAVGTAGWLLVPFAEVPWIAAFTGAPDVTLQAPVAAWLVGGVLTTAATAEILLSARDQLVGTLVRRHLPDAMVQAVRDHTRTATLRLLALAVGIGGLLAVAYGVLRGPLSSGLLDEPHLVWVPAGMGLVAGILLFLASRGPR